MPDAFRTMPPNGADAVMVQDDPVLRDSTAMVLSWLRTAVPSILQNSGHPIRRQRKENPVNTLAHVLSDAVVLADLVSFLDPLRLPPSSVMRSTARNALSAPHPSTERASNPSNIDSRQMEVQYKNNSRRIVLAIKKILDDVRVYARFPSVPPPGAVEAYVVDVTATPPKKNVVPSLRLAEVVIAAAVYGPRHNEFRHSIWGFPSEPIRVAFHNSMSAVAHAVALPRPNVLYAAGPPAPRSPSPSVTSPRLVPHPPGIMSPVPPLMSPHARVPSPQHTMSPRPPPSPQPSLNPQMVSPHMAMVQPHNVSVSPVMLPPGSISPQHPAARMSPPVYPRQSGPQVAMSPRAALTGRSPLSPYSSGGPHAMMSPQPGMSPQPTASRVIPMAPTPPGYVGAVSPRQPMSPNVSPSPGRGASPGRTASPGKVTSPNRAASRGKAASPRQGTISRKKSGSKKAKSSHTKKNAGSSSDGIVDLRQGRNPDAAAQSPIDGQNLPSSGYPGDDGMGDRKFSMVTDDGSRESNSPQHGEDSHSRSVPMHVEDKDASREFNTVPAVTEQVIDTDFVQSMKSLEREHQEQQRTLEQYGDTTLDSEPRSKSGSDEFYTPNEAATPTNESQSVEESTRVIELSAASASASTERQDPSSLATAQETSPYYAGPNVNETVRQSITTSITKQMTGSAEFGKEQTLDSTDAGSQEGHRSAEMGSALYRQGSEQSIDFNDPSYMLSPSASDAPSPSNQWQISRQRKTAQNILSPQVITSPPSMPARLSRSTHATQMTPPRAPPLFQSGSPQLSVSSAGGYDGTTEMEQYQQMKNNPRVSFAPHIISPGGHERPLGQPLKDGAVEEQGARESAHHSNRSFTLPPCAGPSNNVSGQNASREPVAMSTGGQISPSRPSQSYREDVAGDADGNPEFEPAGSPGSNDSFSEGEGFEEVEEVEIYDSDEHNESAEPRNTSDYIAPELNYSDEESYMDNPRGHLEGGNAQLEDYGRIDSELAKAYSTPRYTMPDVGSVPPTPPSPPGVQSLIESFTEEGKLPPALCTRAVSTMEPSPGLFQKLISVWQGSDEGDREDQPITTGVYTERTKTTPVDAVHSESTRESTLPSGDTDLALGVTSHSDDGTRNRRPRAVRLPRGATSPEQLSESAAQDLDGSKARDHEEKTSVASFSDVFSSEERDVYDNRGIVGGGEWEEAMKGDCTAGIPLDSEPDGEYPVQSVVASSVNHQSKKPVLDASREQSNTGKTKSHSTSTRAGGNGVVNDGHHIKIDRRRLDWLTKELLAARDAVSRKELQMTFAETQRLEQREVLLLEKQDAESMIGAMKKILAERENELKFARSRLSQAIQSVPATQDRSSLSSRSSAVGESENLAKLIKDKNDEIQKRIDRSDAHNQDGFEYVNEEMRSLWSEVQKGMLEKMLEMTERRDEELAVLRRELENREKLVLQLQQDSADLHNKNREYQTEASNMRLEKEKSAHHYELEMSHVTAQVELVNEFSKKLHDNFRETENLRLQVLHYQEKLSHITSTSGVSQRQIKELREAVTRANDECARLRREADLAKRKGMEAIRRAEELEELRIKDEQAHAAGRYPDRQDRTDSGSFRSHEPVRPAGHNRPGGSGINTRYHGATRTRGVPSSPTPAQKAWLVIKDKIGGIVTGKDGGSSRKRIGGHSRQRDHSRGGSGSPSSAGHSRSRASNDDEIMPRTRSGSARSRSSNGSGGSSGRSGGSRSNRSGNGGGRRMSPVEDANPYMHSSPYGRADVSQIRATDF